MIYRAERHAGAADLAIRVARYEHADPFQFAAGHKRADFEPLAGVAARAIVDRAYRGDLNIGEAFARLGVAVAASDRGSFEVAGPRIGNLSVGQPVEPVAGLEDRIVQQRHVGGGQNRLAVGTSVGLRQPAMVERVLDGKIERGRTRGNAVVIGRIALRGDKRLAATVRTAREIGKARHLPVERLDQGLGSKRGDVVATVGEVDPLVSIFAPGSAHAMMAHVVAGQRDRAVGDGGAALVFVEVDRKHPTQPAAAGLQEPLGPARERQPDLEVDVARNRAGHLAIGFRAGDFVRRQCRSSAGRAR